MRLLSALALCLALAALPAVAAQAHEHSGTAAAHIAHDAPPGGRTYVGQIASFAVVDDADHDLKPDVHQDNHIRVTLNGAVLWEATAAAGHDYDGVNAFSVVFPVPGAYEVALLGDGGTVQARYAGVVEVPHAPVDATVQVQAPASVPALTPADLAVAVDAGGAPAPARHADAVVEVREGLDLVFRTHLHTHDPHLAPMAFSYAFPRPGSYTVRATGYLAHATGTQPEFAPATAEALVQVGPPQPRPSAPGPAPAAPSPVPQNIVVAGATKGGPYQLFGTYDPYTVAGPATQMRLAALVMDPGTGGPLQHVDFEASLSGPLGPVFASQSLHEYDGVYELVSKQPAPGAYTLAIDVAYGNWTGHVELPYTVTLSPPLPDPSAPAAPALVGPVTVAGGAEGAVAGTATTITLAAKDAAGNPHQHSEVDVVVLDALGNGLLWAKLHTHGDGLFPLTYAFPAAGAYTLRVAPSALDGAPASYLGGPLGAAVDLPITVAAGPGFPAAALQAGVGEGANRAAPGAAPLPVLALLGAGLALRRRS